MKEEIQLFKSQEKIQPRFQHFSFLKTFRGLASTAKVSND